MRFNAKPVMLKWRSYLLAVLACMVGACSASQPTDTMVGVGITGIDQLPEDYLSVQDFSVDGYNAAQAGKRGSNVCCAMLPQHWRPGLTVKVHWLVTDWKVWKDHTYDAVVPVDHYDEAGHLWVHFLSEGKVRVVCSSRLGPNNPDYPGPRDPIPNKEPWHQYPPPK